MQDDKTAGKTPFQVRHRSDKVVVRMPLEKPSAPHGQPPGRPSAKGHQSLPALIRGSEVRKIRTRSHVGYTGEVPMTRLGGKLASAESLLEFDFLIVTDDTEKDIVDIVSQPFIMPIAFGPRGRSNWTPDFRIDRRGAPSELVEVKSEKAIHPAEPEKRRQAVARVDAMRAAANALGFQFRLLTEREIRVQPRLDNARLVHRAMSPFLPETDILTAAAALEGLPIDSSIPALEEMLPTRLVPYSVSLTLQLERRGLLRLDRRQAIRRDSSFNRR